MQQSVDDTGTSFTPLVVVELAVNTTEEAIKWLLSRIRDKQEIGGVELRAALLQCFPLSTATCVCMPGADLLVEQVGLGVGGQEKENPHIFLVGATRQRLLSGAEEVGLFKEYNDGSMRGFTCANKHNFTEFMGNASSMFTHLKVCVECEVFHYNNNYKFKLNNMRLS